MLSWPSELRSTTARWADYVAVARPGYWFKNIFMLPGMALALVLRGSAPDLLVLWHAVAAVIATCCIVSANYTINEWLDAPYDRHHPVKRHRPSVSGRVTAPGIYTQWAALAAAGLTLGATLGHLFLLFGAVLLVMGICYNVPPIRTKDRPFLDVLSEAVNNPLRFILGWSAIVPAVLPPSSILFAYWMGGAYLMAVKRYAEYRTIGNAGVAALYRRSFAWYSEASLLLSGFFYALLAAFFLGVFLIKYRIEFLLAMPFLAGLFVWYLHLGMQPNSVAQSPEKLYRERAFMSYVILVSLIVAVLFFIDLPQLNILVDDHVLRHP